VLLKSYSSVALVAAREVNEYLENLTDNITADLSDQEGDGDAKALLKKWAEDHPITTSIGARESVSNEVTEISIALGLSLGETVNAMVSTMDDLNRKLDVYSDQIPAQARWQAELFAMDAVEELKLQESTEKLPALIDTTIATMETLQAAPALVASEREIVLEAMRAEIALTLETLRSERQALMTQVTEERIAVMTELEANRIAVTEDLRAERKALEAMVERERDVILEETEELRARLIDEVFIKTMVILVLVGVYLAILVFIVLWFLDRRLRGKKREANT